MKDGYKQEWVGEAGYCNCLLVTMSRVPIAEVRLASNEKVPNLETLAAGRPKTADWLKAQGLEYDRLEPLAVIETLSGIASFSRLPWKRNRGQILVHDVVEDNGPIVERIYLVARDNSDGRKTLVVKLKGA